MRDCGCFPFANSVYVVCTVVNLFLSIIFLIEGLKTYVLHTSGSCYLLFTLMINTLAYFDLYINVVVCQL